MAHADPKPAWLLVFKSNQKTQLIYCSKSNKLHGEPRSERNPQSGIKFTFCPKKRAEIHNQVRFSYSDPALRPKPRASESKGVEERPKCRCASLGYSGSR